jgi:hypothetical protein
MALERVSYCVNAAAIRYPDPSDSIVDDSPSPRQTRVRLWAFTANPRSVWSDVPDRQICVDDIGAIAHQLQAKLLCSFRPRRQSDTIIGEQSKQFPPHEIDVVVFRCGDQMYFKPVRHCALPLCRSAVLPQESNPGFSNLRDAVRSSVVRISFVPGSISTRDKRHRADNCRATR